MRGGTARDPGTRRGFSLLEILLVLVIMVAVGGLVLVSIGDRASSIKHDDAVGLIVQAAADARTEAMRSGTPVRLVATNRDTQSRPRVRIAWIRYDRNDDDDLGGDVFAARSDHMSIPGRGALDDPAGWSDQGDPAGWSTPPEAMDDRVDGGNRFTDIADLPRGVSLVRRTLRPLVPQVDRAADGPDASRAMGSDASGGFGDDWNQAFDGAGDVPVRDRFETAIQDPGDAGSFEPDAAPSGSTDGFSGPTPTDTITLGVFLPDGTAWGDAPVLVMTDAAFVSRLTTSRMTGSLRVEPMRFADPTASTGDEMNDPGPMPAAGAGR